MNWDSVIREMFACGIRNPGKNPESWTLESGIQLEESGILLLLKSLESRIQVPLTKMVQDQMLRLPGFLHW